MRKNIAISKEAKDKLCRIFRVTDRTVRNALNLEHPETDLIKRIRIGAMESGGVCMITLPEVETIHTADGLMEQRLPNGASLRFYREDGRGEIWFRGEIVETRESVTIKDIYAMQEAASLLEKGYERAV